jgi:predicted amidohydrolase YtcJ
MNNSIETYRRIREVVREVRATDYRGYFHITEDGAIDLIVTLFLKEGDDLCGSVGDCTCTGGCRSED